MITETNGRRPAAAVGGRGETQPGAGDEGAVARRVARNSLLPFAAGMAGRVLALALAMVMARTLGASGSGLYAVAVNLWLYASIVVDFGLGTWLTREVARRPEGARDTVADALGLRLGLAVCALPLLLLAALGAGFVQGSGPDAVLLMTVALLGMGLLPGAVSAAGTSLFYAFEDMTFPALVQLGTAALTTLGGAALLLAGFDVVALAWVSLAVNLLTAAVFTVACARRYVPLRASLHPARQLALAREALPLMLNSLLNNVFFRFDVQVLQSKGTAVVGYYVNAYKVIDTAGAIPSSFVLALFPLLARRAGGGGQGAGPQASALGEGRGGEPAGLSRVYRLALKLLVATALAIAVPVTFLASEIVALFWGQGFLPDSAIALRILIWFLPLSFFNGLTQYVLIAVGRQARITIAFAFAALFNVGANLLLVPRYGYVAAAWITIVSEVVLLVPFLLALRGRLPVGAALGDALRPLPAALVAGLFLALAGQATPPEAIPLRLLLGAGAVAVYLVLIPLTRVFDGAEWGTLLSLLPRRWRPGPLGRPG
jgi:O-antigen/teichoic acid export membrane protein